MDTKIKRIKDSLLHNTLKSKYDKKGSCTLVIFHVIILIYTTIKWKS